MQTPRHIGRRVAVDVRRARRIGLRVVEPFGLPRALPALLDAARLVPRLHALATAHRAAHPTGGWGLCRNYARDSTGTRRSPAWRAGSPRPPAGRLRA